MKKDLPASAPSSPVVSVIIPVRNGRDFIHEAIDSILAQSFECFEILVMNDGSNDYDYHLLEEIDPRIYVTNLEGGGVSHARNSGMEISRGDYIAFLDADDIWFPGKLAAQIRHFERHPDVGVVFGGYTRWEKSAEGAYPPASSLVHDCTGLIDFAPERSGWLYTRLLMGLLVGMNTAVIRKQLYCQLGGFDESMQIGEDHEYWLRASRVTQMHALAGPVALYRFHSASAMHRLNTKNHLAALLKSSQNRWGLDNPDGTRLSNTEFNARLAALEFSHAYNHFWHGEPGVARASFFLALRGGHRPFRSLVYLLLSYLKSWKLELL